MIPVATATIVVYVLYFGAWLPWRCLVSTWRSSRSGATSWEPTSLRRVVEPALLSVAALLYVQLLTSPPALPWELLPIDSRPNMFAVLAAAVVGAATTSLFLAIRRRRPNPVPLPSLGVQVLAGVTEEFTWRLVLPAFLVHATGSLTLAILWSSLAFAAGHLRLGSLWASLTFLVALGLNIIVSTAEGGLATAITFHIAHGVWTWLLAEGR